MISWRLWMAIYTPFVAHPLYLRWGVWSQKQEISEVYRQLERRAQRLVITVLVIAAVVLHLFGAVPLVVFTFGVPFVLIVVGIPLSLLITGTVYGAICASTVAMTIAREQYQGRFALMGLTPYGKAGAAWALGTIAVQKHPLLKRVRYALQPTYFVIIFVLVIPMALAWISLTSNPGDAQMRNQAENLASVLLLAVYTIIDFIQSGNVGCMVGMLIPTSTDHPGSANALSIVGFGLMQVLSYVVVAVICVFGWPTMGVDQGLSYYLLCTLTAYVFREVLIVALWFLLLQRLDAEPGELAAIDNLLGLGFLRSRKTT